MKRTIKSIVNLMSFGFIGLALLSCSKNETVSVNQDKAIGFNTYTGRAVTKADNTLIGKDTTELKAGSKFVVYAYNTGNTAWAGSVSNVFMKDVTVTYNGGDATDPNKYPYSPLRYWPNDETNNLLSFFAYYPQGGANIVAPDNGWGDYTLTVKKDPADMIDFCVSEVAPDQTYTHTNSERTGIVNMKFYHTLTMVKFQIKTDKDYNAYVTGDDNTQQVDAANSTVITLKNIKLTGVYSKGILSPKTDHLTFDWGTSASDSTTFQVFPTSKSYEVTKDAAWLPSTNKVEAGVSAVRGDAFLMIPQTLTDKVIATVTYTVKTGNDDPVTNTARVQLNLAEDANPSVGQTETVINKWKMNQNIVYTFVVGLNPIQFIAEVADWDDVTTATDFVIPPVTTGDDNGNNNNNG